MIKFFLTLILAISLNTCFAIELSDQVAIEKVIKSYTTAWNQNKGKGFADGFTTDADFVNIFGMSFSGKEAIEKRHITILETFLKETTLNITDVALREETPVLVIAKVYWKLDGFIKQSPDSPDIRKGIFTQVFVKEDSCWKISASQNTLITK